MDSKIKYNVILVGESGVGKTSMTIYYVKNQIPDVCQTTVVVDLETKSVQVKGEEVELRIWDSGGLENYRSTVPQYFRVADGCILVYDVTRITTFHKLSNWLSEFRDYKENAPVIIVGNKIDDVNSRAVSRSVIKSYADRENMDFLECSAKTGSNVDTVFELLLQKIWESKNPVEPTISRSFSETDSLPNSSLSNLKESAQLSSQVSVKYESENVENTPSFNLTQSPPKQTSKKKSGCC